jgi:hypothetical protein
VPRAAARLTPSHEGSNKMLQRRALVVWFVIILAETVHGVLRQLFLVPIVGDLRARQIGVLVGSLIILAVALLFSRWLGARTLRAQLLVGSAWVALTLAFELALGAALGLSLQRLLEDYDFSRGGLMVLGMLVMLLAPAVAARLRGA